MDIKLIYNTINSDIENRYNWKSVTHESIIYTANDKIIIYCDEYIISKKVSEKYRLQGIPKDVIILQICQWIRERVNPICEEFKAAHVYNFIPFEMVYRWKDVDVLTDYYN